MTDEAIDLIALRAQNRPSMRTFVITFLMGGAINQGRCHRHRVQ
jgi:hypothetical protein